MTFILTLFTSMPIMAHAPVQDLLCTYNNQTIEIRIKEDQAFLKLPQEKSSLKWEMPESADQWDPKNKQIFDTYNFEKDQKKITLKVPETKGPMTEPVVLFENKTYNCRTLPKK